MAHPGPQALILHRLGREWSLYESQSHAAASEYRRLLGLFADRPDRPLSIHRLVAAGQRGQGKAPGDW